MEKTFCIQEEDLRGTVREMDDLGRIVIPKEFRRCLDFHPRSKVEMILFKNGVFIRETTEK